ncbi:hypothetical protein EMIT0347P_50090 [Pseudomonas sp. IT-347P]
MLLRCGQLPRMEVSLINFSLRRNTLPGQNISEAVHIYVLQQIMLASNLLQLTRLLPNKSACKKPESREFCGLFRLTI